MRIEALEQTRSPQGKLRLRLEGGQSLLIYPSVAADFGLCAGKVLSKEEYEAVKKAAAAASAKERAVRIVSVSTVSEKELEHRLRQKGEQEEDAKAAVAWLRELRLLDDAQAARQVVQSGVRRGYGAARIRQMLYEKRIPRELWAEALEEIPPQTEAIDAFLQRQFRGEQPDRKQCKRAADALLRRGHSWSEIRSALERYAPEEEFCED